MTMPRARAALVLPASIAAAWLLLSPPAVRAQSTRSAEPAPAADASTPAGMYAKAQTREDAARALDPPALSALRSAATTYELIFREFPTSGYADNAVWQCAELLSVAYHRSGDADDRARAEKWFAWLKSEYPSSPFVKKVDGELDALRHAAPAPAASESGASPAGGPAASTPTAPASTVSAASSPLPPAAIKGFAVSSLPQGQRITIELSRDVTISRDRVSDPDRVYVDFAGTTVPASVVQHAESTSGPFLKGVRIGHPTPGVTRFVFDLANAPRYSATVSQNPAGLVVDLVDPHAPAAPAPADVSRVAASGGATITPVSTVTTSPSRPEHEAKKPAPPPVPTAPASTTSTGEYSLGRQLGLGVSRIVIDPGHGGHDPGAMANGVTEAELVLDVALRLDKLLTDLGGFQVVLTRRTDEFIPLEERTAIANRQPADLFLSIHANASRDSSARGVETYFLNLATSPSAEAVAARENALSTQNMGAVPELVKAITLNNKLKESREFAGIVQSALVQRLTVQNHALKDLGVKQAPFVVLIGATMPSVLAEISFLTNPGEATLLKQGGFRQRIAQALCDAIVKYQASLKKSSGMAVKEGGR